MPYDTSHSTTPISHPSHVTSLRCYMAFISYHIGNIPTISFHIMQHHSDITSQEIMPITHPYHNVSHDGISRYITLIDSTSYSYQNEQALSLSYQDTSHLYHTHVTKYDSKPRHITFISLLPVTLYHVHTTHTTPIPPTGNQRGLSSRKYLSLPFELSILSQSHC